MSIDEPIGKTEQANVNSNNNRASIEPSNNTEQFSVTSLPESNKSVESSSTSVPSSSSTIVTLSDVNNNNNLSDSVKNSNASLSTNAQTTTKTASNGENLIQSTENFNEKKRKLTLPLGGVSSSPSGGGSELSSISSTDSNKHLNSLNQTGDQLKITNSTTNEDLVKHLGNHNISTPQIDKFLLDLIPNNSHLGMKTPGSATLAILTPNGSLSYNNLLQSQLSYSGANIFNMDQFKTPNEENAMNITLAQQNTVNNTNNFNDNNNSNNSSSNNNNNSNNNNGQYRRQNSELNHVYVNPNEIFINQEGSNQVTTNPNIPKYTTLNNVSDMNGNTQNSLILATDNANKLTNSNNLTGNYVMLNNQSNNNQHQSTNINKPNEAQRNEQAQINFSNNSNMFNNSTNKILNTIKEEFHTVPEHPSVAKTPKTTQQAKRKINNSSMNNSKMLKADKQLPNGSVDGSVDSLNNNHSASIIDRRDTGNSSIDSVSNHEGYSPIDLDNQARLKIEIKRERNREAARKCRTRKLEKIAHLEIQVKALSEANEIEKAKNETLEEEINRIRQKLEMHKKIHNCDLKMM